MAFGAFIRFNPEHAPPEPKLGGGAIPQLKIKPPSIPTGMGPTAHLGHFANPSILAAGHNTTDKHPGFKAVQGKIAAKEGVSKKAAGAILANATRHASSDAKKRNPRLKRVK